MLKSGCKTLFMEGDTVVTLATYSPKVFKHNFRLFGVLLTLFFSLFVFLKKLHLNYDLKHVISTNLVGVVGDLIEIIRSLIIWPTSEALIRST